MVLAVRMTTLTHRGKRADTSTVDRNDLEDEDTQGGTHSEEENDYDSKALRLTLMEEILLLGLKDKEVRSVQESFSYCFFSFCHLFL